MGAALGSAPLSPQSTDTVADAVRDTHRRDAQTARAWRSTDMDMARITRPNLGLDIQFMSKPIKIPNYFFGRCVSIDISIPKPASSATMEVPP